MYCPKCGKEIQENQKICTNCGTFSTNKLFIICITVFILLIIVVLLSFTRINCKQYPYNEEKIFNDWNYAQYFMQCTIDKNITPLNQKFKFKEQEESWNTIYFLFEHLYDDAERYGNGIPKNLPGKYNSMEKLDKAVFKESTLYQLGMIATNEMLYVGPAYMYGNVTWNDYYHTVIEQYKPLRKFNKIERLVFIQRICNQMEYFRNNIAFSNSYYFNTYIMHLIGIANNNLAVEGKYGFKYQIKRLYFEKKQNDEILQFINSL